MKNLLKEVKKSRRKQQQQQTNQITLTINNKQKNLNENTLHTRILYRSTNEPKVKKKSETERDNYSIN